MKAPCLTCGTPTDGPRCPEHRLPAKPRPNRRAHYVHKNPAAWKKVSQQLRQQQPFCTWCGSREDLTVDHIVPLSEDPTRGFDRDNLQVLCRRHNSAKGTGVDPHRPTLPPHGKAFSVSHFASSKGVDRDQGGPEEPDRG